MKTPISLRNICGVSIAVAFFCVSPLLFAGNTWTGGGTTNNWNEANNWGGATPAYGTATFNDTNNGKTTVTLDGNYNMNQLLWTGTQAWLFNNSGGAVMSLFDLGGGQAKVENQSTGLVTITAPILFAANNGSPPNPFGEINAVNGGLTFGNGGLLTVSGSSVNGIKLFGSGQTVSFNGTVNANNATNGSAGNKWFGFTTGGSGNTANIGGTFNSGDFYAMNNGVLNLVAGGTLNTTAIRLGGDFGNTGNQDLTKGGTFQLASATGGQTYSSVINTVTSNTSGILQTVARNTSGTDTLSGHIALDSDMRISTSPGGTLNITQAHTDGATAATGTDIKGRTLNLGVAAGSTINVSGDIYNSTGAGGVTLIGSGTVNYTGVNTYTGNTAINGATLTIDSTTNNTNHVADNDGILLRGGTISLIGNAAGTTETVGGLTDDDGANTISVTNNGGTGTQLTFTDSGSLRDSTKGTVNFTNSGTGTLGAAGNNARITFTGALNTNTSNGMLSSSASSATAQTIGWATVNGSSWAGVGANGIVALADTIRNSATLGSAASWELTNFTPSTTVTTLAGNLGTSASVSLGALKITPTGAGQSLAIGTNSIFAPALMLAGTTDFAITGTTGGLTIGGSGTRYVYVVDANTTLSYGASFSIAAAPLNKSGAGYLDLNGSTNQIAFSSNQNVNLLQGVLRGTTTTLGGGTSAGGANTTLNFRGGTLELSGGGSFTRAVDLAGTASGGGITWDGGAGQRGSGGFSAIGGNASFTLVTTVGGATAANLVWNDGLFVQDGYALLFGSTKSDSIATLTNNVGLDAGSASPLLYNAREIRVTGGTAGQAGELSGNVTGSAWSDLLKTGTGNLILSGTNTYAGRTLITAGTLTVGNAGATGTLGSGDVLDNGALVFNRTGSVAVANAISGTGTVAHNGSGTTSLTGANTYSGGTNINNGTLLVNNSTGSATGSGAVNVNAGGTLGGGNPAGTTGFINAGANNITINANGTLAPGNSVGALTLTAANVIFAGTDASNLATYAVEISGATSDLLKITGVLDLNSLFDQISFAGAPDGTSTYALAQYSSVTGTFDNFPTLPAGYTLSYGATELDLTPVPEPATWVAGALMAIGIGVFSIRRHRRRAFVAR